MGFWIHSAMKLELLILKNGYDMKYEDVETQWKNFEDKWLLNIYFMVELPKNNDDHWDEVGSTYIYKLKTIKVNFKKYHMALKFSMLSLDASGWYYPKEKGIAYDGFYKHYHPEFITEFESLFENILTYLKERTEV